MQEALFDFQRTSGVVATITNKDGSKSGKLAEALSGDKKIVVCTIQTFPFALEAVTKRPPRRTAFAVIADEARKLADRRGGGEAQGRIEPGRTGGAERRR